MTFYVLCVFSIIVSFSYVHCLFFHVITLVVDINSTIIVVSWFLGQKKKLLLRGLKTMCIHHVNFFKT